jgi:hypothetical protein
MARRTEDEMAGDDSLSTLTPADLAMFDRFGVDEALLRAAQVRRVADPEARNLLGTNRLGDLAGLFYPYFDPVSGYRVSGRLRRDKPEIGLDGKTKDKYICAYGDNRHLYFPPGADALLNDLTAPVVMVEAEKSALAITALASRHERRLLAIATGGCWGWHGKVGLKATATGGRDEERGPLPDLFLITWEGERQVIIVFDSNTATNARVRVARWRFAQTLVGLGAKVLFVDVPGEGGVNGPDDLISAAGDEGILKLLETARPFAGQAEKDAGEVVQTLSRTTDLEDRDRAIEMISLVADVSHQRILAGRAAKALGEPKAAIERAVGAEAAAYRKLVASAKESVRQERLSRLHLDHANLIASVEEFYALRRYLPPGAALLEALFCINTYVFDVCDTTPYLLYESAVPGCGKTTSLERHEAICARPYLGADASPATFYRRIDRDHPTWLLDEAAILQTRGDRAVELLTLYDIGYKKGARVGRYDAEANELRDFDCFCPKALARIGGFKGTLLDRGIVIHLEKAPKGWPHSRRKVINREAAPLQEGLEAYALQYRPRLEELYDKEPDEGYWPELSGREAEVLGPLLLHAKLAGPEVERRALSVALELSRKKVQIALSEDRNLSLAQELLEVLGEMECGTFSPGELVALLDPKEEWGEKLARAKTEKAKVCSVGGFLTRYRLNSRKRTKTGTAYDRIEALGVIGRQTPEINAANATNATETVNMRSPEVASAKVKHATGDALEDMEDTNPVAVVTAGGAMASAHEEDATPGTCMNTGQVASGISRRGDKQGELKF